MIWWFHHGARKSRQRQNKNQNKNQNKVQSQARAEKSFFFVKNWLWKYFLLWIVIVISESKCVEWHQHHRAVLLLLRSHSLNPHRRERSDHSHKLSGRIEKLIVRSAISVPRILGSMMCWWLKTAIQWVHINLQNCAIL